MKKILFLLTILLTSIACRKEDAPVYPKQIGKINPPAWFQGEWEDVDGASGIGLVVSADNIIKDGIDQKQVIEGQEIIFEDVYKYSQNQYVYTYELKQPIKLVHTYTKIVTELNSDGTEKSKKESQLTDIHSARFLKNYYNFSDNTNLVFQAFLVDASLQEKRYLPIRTGVTQDGNIKTEIKDVVLSEISGITYDDFIKLVKSQKYKKK